MCGITERFHYYQIITLKLSHPKIIGSFPSDRIICVHLYTSHDSLSLVIRRPHVTGEMSKVDQRRQI